MWKDFFYFSKSERRAILFLLTLLFIFMCIWVLFPVKEESLEQDQEGIEEIKNFQYDGDFRKFLDYLAHKNKHKITVYNNYIYIIKNNKLVTVLNVPNKYKNLTPIYTK